MPKQVAEMDRRWIDVRDSLPAEATLIDPNWVLAYFDWGSYSRNRDAGRYQFAQITNREWRPMGGNGNFSKYVTHWMPLPPAPAVSPQEEK